MKFFMFSKCGEGAGLLYRLQQEGNLCRLYIKEKDYSSVYDGILEKSNGQIEKDEIVIFDSSGNGARADGLRKSGYKVFGASKFHDKLEDDREFGLKFMTDHGIKVPNTKSFSDISEGIKTVKKSPDKRFVFKPCGVNLPSRLTYCGSDCDDLVHYLEYVKSNYSGRIDEFILQEFIEGSIISTEYWCGKNGFSLRPNHTIEVKKLMNDDLGPSTGCSGNIVWLTDGDDPIASLLLNIEQDLLDAEYVGPIDINCIIKEGVPYGLEWTPRFGLDAMPTLLQLIEGDLGEIIYDSIEGSSTAEFIDAFAGGVRISIPPYPIEVENAKVIQEESPNKGIPIRGLEDFDRCYCYEVMEENGELYHSDGTGVIAVVSDWAVDLKESLSLPYDILEECKIPDKQFRTDLKEVLSDMYEDVNKELKDVVHS